MSQFHPRVICALATLSLATASGAIADPAHKGRSVAASRVNCSAFTRISANFWTVTAPTIVPRGANLNSDANALGLPRGATVEPLEYRTHGVDLADALNRECGK